MISPVSLKDAGFYICRVNCGDAFEFSQWAQVDVLDADTSCGTVSQFLTHPPSQVQDLMTVVDTADVPQGRVTILQRGD